MPPQQETMQEMFANHPSAPGAHGAVFGVTPRRLRGGMIAILLLAMLLLGCTTQGNLTSTEGTPPPGDVAVEVSLDEFSITLPNSFSAGTVSFEIQNVGDMEHGFAIEGPGIEEALTDPLSAGESFTYTVELAPGTYTIWCPIGNHRQEGMEATIEVTNEPASSEGAPLFDEAVEPSEQEAPIDDGY